MRVKRFLGLLCCVGALLLGVGLLTAGAGPVAPLVWQAGMPLPQPAGDGAAFVLGETLYHAGGWAGDPYQPRAALYVAALAQGVPGGWAQEDMAGRFGAAVATFEGRAYLVGGYDGQDFLSRVDVFDGVEWSQAGTLPQKRNFPAAAVVGGRLYVAGGLPGPVADVWSAPIDEATGSLGAWRAESALPVGLITQLIAWEDCLYVIGGRDGVGESRRQVYYAVWESGDEVERWAETRPLPQPLALHGVAARDGVLYVVGGETTGGAPSDRVYTASVGENCALSDWSSLDLPGAARKRVAVAAGGRGLYLLGGQMAGGAFVNDNYYDLLPTPTPTPTPHLTVQKWATPHAPVGYGQTITYVLAYANPWHETQPGVVLTDRVPAGTTFNSVAPTGTGTLQEPEHVIRWVVGDLTPGAGGTVTFTVQVAPPQRTWTLSKAMDASYATSGTLQVGPQITYTVAYTPGDGQGAVGLLVTDTLPEGLVPLAVTAEVTGAWTYAVQGQDVLWRLDPVAAPGTLQVVACVRAPALSETLTLTNHVMLYDGYQVVSATLEEALPPSTPGSLLRSSCPAELPSHPAAVAPLYPDVKIRNRAWASSTVLSAWQPSNEVVHFWPTDFLYLPLTLRGE